MSYRVKIILSFLVISTISTLIAIGMCQYESRQWILRDVIGKAETVAGSVSVLLNGELVKQIRAPADQNTEGYKTVQEALRKARNVNRRSDSKVKYIYTIYPDPKNPRNFLFGVDAEEDSKNFSPPGSNDPGPTTDKVYDHLFEVYCTGKFTADPWGIWMTGYAPIYDAQNVYVATLGVDIGMGWVKEMYTHLLLFGGITFLVSILVAAIAGFIHSAQVTRSLKKLEIATAEIAKGDFYRKIELKTNDEFQSLAQSMNKMNEGLREKEKLKTGFAQYISQHVLDRVFKTKGPSFFKSEKQKVTIFFSDLVDLSHLEEVMSVEQVIAFLNDYIKRMIDILYKHNGMVYKLIGNGVMAEFVLFPETQEWDAVQAAIEMQREIRVLQDKWNQSNKLSLEIAIAIHTGEGVISGIGNEKQMVFSTIEDAVKQAVQLQDLARRMKYPILISENTYQAIKDKIQVKPLGMQYLSGAEALIKAYEVIT